MAIQMHILLRTFQPEKKVYRLQRDLNLKTYMILADRRLSYGTFRSFLGSPRIVIGLRVCSLVERFCVYRGRAQLTTQFALIQAHFEAVLRTHYVGLLHGRARRVTSGRIIQLRIFSIFRLHTLISPAVNCLLDRLLSVLMRSFMLAIFIFLPRLCVQS